MLKQLLLTLHLFYMCFGLNAQNGPQHVVYFNVDSYTVSAAEKDRFDKYITVAKEGARINSIRIYGHTDSDASDEYNLTLSENRVNSVKALLESAGLEPPTEAYWFGEKKPLNTNNTAEDKRLNRRVDIWIEWVPDYVEESGDIRDLYKLLEQEKQKICIDPKGDTIIRFEQGTIVYFPAYAFGNLSGRCIEIRGKEFYRKSDMIMENLTTTSNGQLLESEGMIYLEASLNDSLINLAPGKEVIILMPTDSIRDDVSIFNGQRDAHTDVMNWVLNSGSLINGLNVTQALFCPDTFDGDIQPKCERCRFLFCRVKRLGKGFKGIPDRDQRSDNKQVRRCQRQLRKSRRRGGGAGGGGAQRNEKICAELDSLFKLYGVSDRRSLIMAMNKELMDQYGVNTLEELRDTLNAIRLNDIETNFASGNASKADLEYYIFNSNQLGWINIDRFSKLGGPKVNMRTTLRAHRNSDCKTVFKSVRGILPANQDDVFFFSNVPSGHDIWLIGLKYREGEAYLSMEETTSRSSVDNFKFKKVTLQELREEIRKVDQ